MLKRSVIAADITNLTDARYFASWGIDYLMFDISQISIDQIRAILEWVDGVKALILISEATMDLIEEVIIKIKPYGIGAKKRKVFSHLLNLNSDCKYFFDFSESTSFDTDSDLALTVHQNIDPVTLKVHRLDITKLFKVAPNDPKDLELALINDSMGIVVKGSVEEQTGLKSFEDVEDILEILSS